MPSAELTRSDMKKLGLFDSVKEKEVLNGLAEIAAYMDCSISTIRRMIRKDGFPACAFGHMGNPYMTTKSLIDRWMAISHIERMERMNWGKE